MYKGRHFNRETVYVTGDYMDGAIYPVFQPAGKRRKKCHPTKAIQARLNQRNAEKKLTRLVHNNFGEEDLALHLTYREGEEPETAEEANKRLRNFLRRLKYRYQKAGMELKYITCTERGKKTKRLHHHLIISGGLDRDEIEKLWGCGWANSKRLQFGEKGVTELARYMTKSEESYKRWNQSRNLVIPEPAQFDGQLSRDEMKVIAEAVEEGTAWQWLEERYPDFVLVEARVYRNGINQGIYIEFDMRKKRGAVVSSMDGPERRRKSPPKGDF